MKMLTGLFGTLLFLILVAPIAKADTPAPARDYILPVGKNLHVFVMLSIEDDRSAYSHGGSLQNEEIRAIYRQSGFYGLTDTDNPIWTVDWYAFTVDISSDGNNLVRWSPWAFSGSYSEIALEFYDRGELLKSYSVSDLVVEPEKLPHSVSHYTWLAAKEFDSEDKTLAIETKNGEKHWFDVASGEIIEANLIENTSGISEANAEFESEGAADTLLNGTVKAEQLSRVRRLGPPLLVGFFLSIAFVVTSILVWKNRYDSKRAT